MDIQETAELLYREEVLRARMMPGEDKLRAGPELFDMACQITLAGIYHQHPGISADDAMSMLKQRLTIRRRSERNERP